ncbi:DUF4037 domain-containing protein [bacterium]|nr:DUF4037 domain-containing protein [bacterium]MBQ8886499.1 DUF4037 domain-containing protein [Candidatus Gastranaerophilales bacterium]
MENKKIVNCILQEFQSYQQVKAIAIGGSISAKTNDSKSDIDVYIFVDKDIPVIERESFVKKYSSKYEVGGEYFGSGDEFFVDKINQQLDVMYWNTIWFEGIIDNIWCKHYPSNAYTTAFLYTLKNFEIIFDTDNWLRNLQRSINTNYPLELKQNIIKRNLMLMKEKPFASYYEQIEKAIKRNDIVSINHRITAFLASYYDVIFATNELLHPGEKRLIQYAKDNCKVLPKDFEENIIKLLTLPTNKILTILNEIYANLKIIL